MDPRTVIPGYSELLDRESIVRDAPFLSPSESIGPFIVRPLTLQDYLAVKRHPLLKGELPTVGDLVVFIRFLWVGNKRTVLNAVARWLFGRRCLKYVNTNYEEVLKLCLDYLDEVFMDATGPRAVGWNPSYYSEVVIYISMFARYFRWTPEYTLSLPMKIALQYKREIEHALGNVPANRSDQLIVKATLDMRRN